MIVYTYVIGNGIIWLTCSCFAFSFVMHLGKFDCENSNYINFLLENTLFVQTSRTTWGLRLGTPQQSISSPVQWTICWDCKSPYLTSTGTTLNRRPLTYWAETVCWRPSLLPNKSLEPSLSTYRCVSWYKYVVWEKLVCACVLFCVLCVCERERICTNCPW